MGMTKQNVNYYAEALKLKGFIFILYHVCEGNLSSFLITDLLTRFMMFSFQILHVEGHQKILLPG